MEQRRVAVGQHVDGERDDPNELDQVAAHDRSAASRSQFQHILLGKFQKAGSF